MNTKGILTKRDFLKKRVDFTRLSFIVIIPNICCAIQRKSCSNNFAICHSNTEILSLIAINFFIICTNNAHYFVKVLCFVGEFTIYATFDFSTFFFYYYIISRAITDSIKWTITEHTINMFTVMTGIVFTFPVLKIFIRINIFIF